jgi:hypothetical protein
MSGNKSTGNRVKANNPMMTSAAKINAVVIGFLTADSYNDIFCND